MKKVKKKKIVIDPLIRNIVIFLTVLVLADLAVILYFGKNIPASARVLKKQSMSEIAAVEYTNPEAGSFGSLKTGGEFSKKMPEFREELKFKMTYDPILAGPNNIHVLQVCCFEGYSKEFFTAKMPWAFLLYDFEPGLPTLTLFDIDGKTDKGRFEIVLLDKKADEKAIKAVAVSIFIELLKQYMPGYEWSASVRKELL